MPRRPQAKPCDVESCADPRAGESFLCKRHWSRLPYWLARAICEAVVRKNEARFHTLRGMALARFNPAPAEAAE